MEAIFIALATLSIQLKHVSASSLAARADVSTTSSLLCNQVGWDAGTESFAALSVGGYTACSSACYADPQCNSFTYTAYAENLDGQLYTTTLKDNFVADPESNYIFYDAGRQNVSNTCGTQRYYINSYAYILSDTWGSSCMSLAWDGTHCYLYHEPAIGNVQPSPKNVCGARAFYEFACATLKALDVTSTTTTTTTNTTTTKAKSTTKATTSTSAKTSAAATTTSVRTSTITIKQSSSTIPKAKSANSTAPSTAGRITSTTTSSSTKFPATTTKSSYSTTKSCSTTVVTSTTTKKPASSR